MSVDQCNQSRAGEIQHQGFEETRMRLEDSGAIEFLNQVASVLGEGFQVQSVTNFAREGIPPSATLTGPPVINRVVVGRSEKGTRVTRDETWRQGISVVASPYFGYLSIDQTRTGTQADTDENGVVKNYHMSASGKPSKLSEIDNYRDKGSVVSEIARTIKETGLVPKDRAAVFEEFCKDQGI